MDYGVERKKQMEKIAFVVVRYGQEINGGAEFHCRMLAEKLVGNYQVEVLTTCVKDYLKGGNEFPEGEEWINGVLVRRFKAVPENEDQSRHYARKAKASRKLRRVLYRLRLLSLVSSFFPVWTFRREYEMKLLRASVFYSPSMFSFIRERKDEYKVFIPITIDFPQAYYTALYAPEKTLLIPTMHSHSVSFRSILTEMFTRVAYIGFNTESEQRLAENIFGSHISRHGIISVSVDTETPSDWHQTAARYHLPEEYLLYVGRVDNSKLQGIFRNFLAYKKKYKESRLKLVLVGGLFTVPLEHPDIIYTGFVSEAEKTAIIQHAKVVVNPSRYESLSLILLEAMNLKRPVLVNGLCNVLKDHCYKSHFAALPYFGTTSFIRYLHRMDTSDALRTEMGEKGSEYVHENYDWSLIMRRLTNAIEWEEGTAYSFSMACSIASRAKYPSLSRAPIWLTRAFIF